VGRRIVLRPLTPADHDWLWRLCTHPDGLARWRYLGTTPSYERVVQDFSNMWVQFVAVDRRTNERVAHVYAYNPKPADAHAWVAVAADPGHRRWGIGVEACILLIEYLFATFGLHKVYAEALEFNYEQFASGAGTIFDVEGHFVDDVRFQGRWWDRYVLAFHRDRWETRPACCRIRERVTGAARI
jgi:RimJ/RimL family protein N-acetyltransferase